MYPILIYLIVAWWKTPLVRGIGLMLLYRPRDATKECALSQYLRYDLSYGMGMSDTTTLVFRTLMEADYTCMVDVVAETNTTILLAVVRYPNSIELNCESNRNAVTVLIGDHCYPLCDHVKEKSTSSIIFPIKGRLKFLFVSNSSINTDINAYVYQVTVTAARRTASKICYKGNETYCSVSGAHYCFTSGVVCDGIQNCGVEDWFDERKSLCDLPIERLGYAPVVAVAAALLCAVLAAAHVLLRCLPPQGNSFFIFNANEDNRLCIDPVLKPRRGNSPEPERPRAVSLVPVFSSSSSSSDVIVKKEIELFSNAINASTLAGQLSKDCEIPPPRRKITMRSMTAKIQEKLRFVTGSRTYSTVLPLDSMETKSVK